MKMKDEKNVAIKNGGGDWEQLKMCRQNTVTRKCDEDGKFVYTRRRSGCSGKRDGRKRGQECATKMATEIRTRHGYRGREKIEGTKDGDEIVRWEWE